MFKPSCSTARLDDRLSLALNDSLDLSYFEGRAGVPRAGAGDLYLIVLLGRAGLGNETWIDAKVDTQRCWASHPARLRPP